MHPVPANATGYAKRLKRNTSKEVKVDFHDVWTEAGKPFGIKYGIETIPTQVLIDETGKEYYRHQLFRKMSW